MRRYRRGNALIEFALSAGVLAALMLGTFRYGYTFYIYDQLQSAVRNGARYASQQTYYDSSASCRTKTVDAVKYMTVYGEPVTAMGNLPAGTFAKVRGLAVANVSVTYTPAAVGTPKTQVELRITNFTVNSGIGSTTFTNKPFAVIPFLGTYAAATACP